MKRKRVYDIDDPRSSYGHRQPQQRSRGHGGHYRRYNNHRHHQHHQQHHHHHQQPQDEPMDREQERMSRIRQLLVRIGERSSSTLAHNLDQLSNALLVDIEHYRSFIISTLFECIVHLAVKIPIYATLVGLINHVKQDFGKEIVNTLSNEIMISLMIEKKDSNDSNDSMKPSIIADTANQRGLTTPIIDFNRIRLLTRFAVCLYNTNLIALQDILNLIQCLMKQGLHENIHPFIREHICYIIISMLIWCINGDLLKQQNEDQQIKQEITNIIQTIDKYVRDRPNIKNPLAFKSFKNVEIDFLSDIWNTFIRVTNDNNNDKQKNNNNDDEDDHNNQDEKNDEKNDEEDKVKVKDEDKSLDKNQQKHPDKTDCFMVKSIHSPYKEFSRLKKKYSHSLSINMDGISPWNGLSICNLLPIWIEFGIATLLDQASITELEQFVVIDYIHDIILYFNQDTKLCAEQLINLPSSFESKYIVIEAIISKMLLLPSSASGHHFIFFGKIIIELFRKQTKVWPRVVGPIINKMFHEISLIDIECRDRLIEWFSFHLANFNFQWPWENWSAVCSYPVSAPKTSFVQSVMIKCLHLSYYDRFKKTLPNDIISIVPIKPDGNYKKYIQNDIASNLLRLLNQRQSPEDITNHLETYIEARKPKQEKEKEKESESMDISDEIEIHSFQELDEISINQLSETQDIILQQIELLFICILHVGKSSCSHVLSVLKMYGKKPLKQLISSTPNQFGELILIKCLYEYWQYSPIRIQILSDKLHAMNYISPQCIIKFCFLNENILNLYKQIYWIMIKQSIDRLVKTQDGMKRGIVKFKKDINELNKNLNSDFNDQELINNSKQNKQKQLDQLQLRLNQTQIKISNVFVLFYKSCLSTLVYLNNAEIQQIDKNDKSDKNDHDDGNDDNDDMEIDDDMLMSEQFIQHQEKMDKEKEKAAILKSREANINKYIFDIITGRMIEIARRFYQNIDNETWNKLKSDTFANLQNDNENHKEIVETINTILQLRDILM